MDSRPPDALNDRLPGIVEALVENSAAHPKLLHLNRVYLPSRDVVIEAIKRLRQLVFPGYFNERGLTHEQLRPRTETLVRELAEMLYDQVRCCLRYRDQIPTASGNPDECVHCDAQAAEIVATFFDRLPQARELLDSDVQAAFQSDPAAHNTDETIFCYPGLFAVMVQRLAHEFYRLEVPLLPRIMTEYAHSLTGIDIHPGAQLGKSFFIDHGTGVVIGETTRIGDNVKIYQGVTLGALAPAYGQMLRGQKRHPSIESNVTIYANSSILGGETVIGQGSVIGGNVFITSSVPPLNHVIAEPPKLTYRDRRPKKMRMADVTLDFQI
jgi:serine O-acetyltransferase